MHRMVLVGLVLGVCLGVAGMSKAAVFDDKAVEKAIQKGVAFLKKSQSADGSWGDAKPGSRSMTGPTALVTYALLESDISPQDDQVQKALYWMAKYPQEEGTYALGLRCNAWQVANRSTRGKYLKCLRYDAKKLWMAGKYGCYHYVADPKKPGKGFDNSNTQYGLLGVWAAARDNLEVPMQYWNACIKHWEKCQNADGGWAYGASGASTPTMTAAGVASLFVCYDQARSGEFTKCNNRITQYPRVKRGLDWFDKNFAGTMKGVGGWTYYYLYGVERVGLASGYKYFGTSDWYQMGAKFLLAKQGGGGNWGSVVNTSFALLFLVRGRNAVIFNKLEFNGDWNNRPRDLANVTRWMSKTFERTVNWQIINLKVPVREWHDAPILYISGSRKPVLDEAHIAKLRMFVNQGGTILGVSECGGAVGFKKGMRDLYKQLFPNYPLTLCKSDHPIYSRKVHFDLPNRPKFHVVTNGVRPLIVHTDEDLPLCWQMRRTVTRKWAYQAAANIVRYVTDRVSMVRPRGTTHWPAKYSGSCSRTIKLARLKHGGNFDPEPLAYERFGALLASRHKIKLDVAGPMDIKDLAASGAAVATLTGTGELKLTDAQKAALKTYVEKGGLLVVDAAGGSRAFADSAEKILKKMYGSFKLRILSGSSRLFRQSDMAVSKVKYRRRTKLRLGGRSQPNLKGVMVGGRVGVVFSREDITGGLVGYPSWTVDGYQPDSAFEVMRNIVASAK